MVSETKVKAYPRSDRGGWIIYLPKHLIQDSNFPLKPTEDLLVKIESNKISIRNK